LLTSDFAFCDVTVPLSASLSVTFVHCAQTAEDIDTISFTYEAPCLFQIALKFGLHRSIPSSPNFAPSDSPCWSTERCCFLPNCLSYCMVLYRV